MHPLEDLRLAASMAQSLMHELEGQAGRDSFEREQLDEVAHRLAAQLRLVSAENPA
jgi:hypothetical protein